MLLGALGGQIKRPDGIHFRVEQLDPIRIVSLRREHIQNASANAVLASALYHGYPLVPLQRQPFPHFIQLDIFSPFDFYHVFCKDLSRRQLLDRSSDRRNDHAFFAPAHRPEHAHPLQQIVVAPGFKLDQRFLLRRQDVDFFLTKKRKVRCQPFRPVKG